jgi:phosphatidylglycerophosphatase A
VNLSKIIASCFGIGLIKGGGTIAAFIFCILLYGAATFNWYSNVKLLFFVLALLFIGVYISKEAERTWGKDSNHIVIDELLGMAIGMLFLPINVKTLAMAFLLFRFFDIIKPLYIKRLENLVNGWGVMMDDALAGIYTNIVMQVLILFQILK